MSIKKILGNKVLFKPIIQDNETESGVYIPETHQRRVIGQGEVIKMSKNIKKEVGIGDIILFNERYVKQVKIEGEKLGLININDILGILK